MAQLNCSAPAAQDRGGGREGSSWFDFEIVRNKNETSEVSLRASGIRAKTASRVYHNKNGRQAVQPETITFRKREKPRRGGPAD